MAVCARSFKISATGSACGLSQPGFSLTIVLTLALAIGANTVIFSFTNVLLLRPLPLHDQKTIAFIFMVDPQRGGDRGLVSIPDLLDYRSALTSFNNIAATTSANFTMSGRGDATALTGSRVTANLFETWGLKMAAGQPFLRGDDLPGSPEVVVLSHTFWKRQFDGDPAIVGQALTLNGRPHTVTGVVCSGHRDRQPEPDRSLDTAHAGSRCSSRSEKRADERQIEARCVFRAGKC